MKTKNNYIRKSKHCRIDIVKLALTLKIVYLDATIILHLDYYVQQIGNGPPNLKTKEASVVSKLEHYLKFVELFVCF